MESDKEQIFIALGSNLDQPDRQVEDGLRALCALSEVQVVNCSGLYSTEPMGPADQPDFVNAVCQVTSVLQPIELLDALQAIEKASGRHANGKRWGPRTLDLDLLLYGERLISSERLTVPHPGLLERSFVLFPLLEIAPNCCVPEKGPAREYESSVENYGIKRLCDIGVDYRPCT